MSARLWKSLLLGTTLSTALLRAADLSSYRGFSFGEDIATAAKRAGLKPSEARVLHQRPILMQELEWEIRASIIVDPPPHPDPVRGGVLSFFDGKLYRIVITYDRYRIEGMTVEDMIDAISLTYGVARHPELEIRFHSNYAEVAKVLARWEDDTYAYDLIRTGDQANFALVLYAKDADRKAQSAILEASRLDVLDAPRRAQQEEKKRLEEARLALEKIRAVNKPNFRP